MKNALINSDGFTLIELLVTINLSGIIFSLVLVFILVNIKFLNITTHNLEDRREITESIHLLNRLFNTESQFTLNTESNTLTLNTANNKTVTFEPNQLKINNASFLNKFDHYSVELKLYDGNKITFLNGKMQSNYQNHLEQNRIQSNEIKHIKMEFSYKLRKYEYLYCTPDFSINKFKNIQTEL